MSRENNRGNRFLSRTRRVSRCVYIACMSIMMLALAVGRSPGEATVAAIAGAPATTSETVHTKTKSAPAKRGARRPRIGIRFVHHSQGARVIEVLDGSPADLAGIKVGDIVTMVAGRTVVNFVEIVEIVRAHDIGAKIEIVVAPGVVHAMTVASATDVTKGRFPDLYAKVKDSWRFRDEAFELFGLRFRTVTPNVREQCDRPGVVVIDLSVFPNRAGSGFVDVRQLYNVRVGDVFTQVGKAEVMDIVDFVVHLLGNSREHRRVRIETDRMLEPPEVEQRGVSTKTWYIQFDEDDLSELEQAYQKLCTEPEDPTP